MNAATSRRRLHPRQADIGRHHTGTAPAPSHYPPWMADLEVWNPRILCTRTTGCLIIVGARRLQQHELRVEVEDEAHDIRTCFVPRMLDGRPAIAAIVPELIPGAYTVACRYAGLSPAVTIRAGQMTRLMWQ